MTDTTDWPGHPGADPDCECCLGDGLQADGETPCPCIDARKGYRAAQAASLTPDGLIDLIGEFGREVCCMLDDCETSGPVGEEVHTITDESLTKVSAILDRIDALPFEEPGVILGTGAMLQAAIKQTFQTYPPQPSVSVAEAALKEARANMQHIKERLVREWSRNGTLELIETHQRKIDAALRALKGGA